MDGLLAVSVGNTNTAIGVCSGSEWLLRCRVATLSARTPDDYRLLLDGLLARVGGSIGLLRRAVLASVVPPTTGRLVEALTAAGLPPPVVVGPEVDTGIEVVIDDPRQIGADLLANAAAAAERIGSGRSVIVADFGTALSFTAVERGGRLRGVAIAPGLSHAVEALATSTAQLPAVAVAPPPAAVGTNTVHAIQSGIFHGYVGLVRHLVQTMGRELPGPVSALATGGQAPLIAPAAGCFGAVEPWLALEGLRLIAARHHR